MFQGFLKRGLRLIFDYENMAKRRRDSLRNGKSVLNIFRKPTHIGPACKTIHCSRLTAGHSTSLPVDRVNMQIREEGIQTKKKHEGRERGF